MKLKTLIGIILLTGIFSTKSESIQVSNLKHIGSLALKAEDSLPLRKPLEFDVRDPLSIFKTPVVIDELTHAERQKLVFDLFINHTPHQDFYNEVLLPAHTIEELNLLCGEIGSLTTSLRHNIDRTQTTFGSVTFAKLLAEPRRNVLILKERQKFVRALLENKALYLMCLDLLNNAHDAENNVLSLWMPHNPLSNPMIKNQLFYSFNGLQFLNRSPYLLEIGRIGNLALSALPAAFATGYTALYAKNYRPKIVEFNPQMVKKTDFLVGAYCAFVCGYGTYNVSQIIQGVERFKKTAQDFMIKTTTLLNTYASLEKQLKEDFKFEKNFTLDKKNLSTNAQKLVTLLKKNTFRGNASSFSFLGRAVAAYNLMLEVKDEFIPLFEALGEIDALVSIATLIKEHQTKNARYCFVDFDEESDTPSLSFTNGWNPLINPDVVITETMHFGKTGIQNLLLTGPHGSGKSSFMREAMYIVLLSQTFGIAPASSCTMTPFAKLNTYLNIKEDYAKNLSTFMAERQRVDEIQDMITSLGQNEFSFTIMDEVFKGTMEEEGAKRVYRYGKVVAEHPHSICLMATHFNFPTRLEDETEGKFVNYHVGLQEDVNGFFTRTFKLVRGKNEWWFNNSNKRDRFIEWLQTVA